MEVILKRPPSVFSTEHNREGIQVGTAIALLVRKPAREPHQPVHFRDLWGQTKRADLLASLQHEPPRLYQPLQPEHALGLPFRPLKAEESYLAWPTLPDLFPVSFPGVFTARDGLLVDVDAGRLRDRMLAYFDPNVSDDEMRLICPQAMKTANRYNPTETRDVLRKRGYLPDRLVRFLYRPFDLRWLYWEPETKLLNEKRAEYYENIFAGNVWIAAVKQNRKGFDPPMVLHRPTTLHIIERGANLFPLQLRDQSAAGLFQDRGEQPPTLAGRVVNLSPSALAFLADRGGVEAAPLLFHHAAAILHSPLYAAENDGALRQDWPRIPLPVGVDALTSSADLGRQVAALLDPEATIPGVDAGKLRPEFKLLGNVARVGGGPLNEEAGELDGTARWGVPGRDGICMPGKGRLQERDYTPDERAAIDLGAAALGLDPAVAYAGLGDRTFDVYLNEVAYWRNVPARVWDYTSGGYQILKKWLSYREKAFLGRGLTHEEMTQAQATVRRIAALLLLQPALDANYKATKIAAYHWKAPATAVANVAND